MILFEPEFVTYPVRLGMGLAGIIIENTGLKPKPREMDSAYLNVIEMTYALLLTTLKGKSFRTGVSDTSKFASPSSVLKMALFTLNENPI
jgi:hypothetical protein